MAALFLLLLLFTVSLAFGQADHGEVPAQVEGHEQDAGHESSIMNVDPGLMIWTVVTFVFLLVVLRFTAWKPLIGALDAREQRIRETVEHAERTQKEGEELLARYHQQLEAAKLEAQHIIEEGKSDALKLKHEITGEARRESEEFKVRARREVELAVDQAKKKLWEEATHLSTLLAEKIVQRSLSDSDHRRLVEEVLDEYRSVRTSSGA